MAIHVYHMLPMVPWYVPGMPYVYIHVYIHTNRTLSQNPGYYHGRVHKAARDWLDALTAPEPGEQVPSQDDHPWNPQAGPAGADDH